MQEIELGLTGVLTMLIGFAFLAAPFKLLSLCGTAGVSLARAMAWVAVGIAGSLAIIAVKAVKKSKGWKPAPEQSFEPASRSYPATPERGERQGETIVAHAERDQPRLVEARQEELIRIGANRPVRK